jgi:hypothetical protein
MTAEYILKHKEIPVMIFIMDDENYKLLDITEILQEDRLPFGLKDRGNKTQYAIQFNNWLTGRGISESRRDIANVKKIFNAKSSKELMIKAYGLNLTDHYWFHYVKNDMSWEDKNYFDNSFDKIIPGKGMNPEVDESVAKQSPNLCVDGSIEKRWVIKNGARVLLKGSLYNRMQEPFNEVIVSKILDEYKINHVHYDLGRTDKDIPYSECKCMVAKNTEYINAQYVMNTEEYYRKEQYIHFLEMCNKNGINDAKTSIDQMIALDFIIGNVDRHKGNFGIIRNADTLEWMQIAPIFDNGNCLFYDSENDEMENWGIDTLGKSFGDSNRLNLQYIEYPEWYKNAGNNYITDIIADFLQHNERLKQERIDKIISVVRDRMAVFENLIDKK